MGGMSDCPSVNPLVPWSIDLLVGNAFSRGADNIFRVYKLVFFKLGLLNFIFLVSKIRMINLDLCI